MATAIAKIEPAIAIHSGKSGGRLRASKRPVSTAERSPSEFSRFIARRQTDSVTTEAAMQVAMERTSGREPLHVRTRIALRLRAMIMAGYMQREHCAEGVAAYQELASRCVVHPAKPLWWVGRMLFRYVALGGRGGWRIALFFLDNVL